MATQAMPYADAFVALLGAYNRVSGLCTKRHGAQSTRYIS